MDSLIDDSKREEKEAEQSTGMIENKREGVKEGIREEERGGDMEDE